MKSLTIVCFLVALAYPGDDSAKPTTLFDGKNLTHWEFNENAWYIEDDHSMSCRMQKVKQKNGSMREKGMGYIWTRESYEDFELSLSYKLSTAANSGIFFRTDKDNPVQGGFEIQLMDDAGYQRSKGEKNPKNLNGAFYDCQAAEKHQQKAVGEWNRLRLTCKDTKLKLEINGVIINEADLTKWDTPNLNPDGSKNKFKTALNSLPRSGRIGFQNHGQQVWFKDVEILAH